MSRSSQLRGASALAAACNGARASAAAYIHLSNYLSIYMNIHTHTHIYIYIYTHIYIYLYICIYISNTSASAPEMSRSSQLNGASALAAACNGARPSAPRALGASAPPASSRRRSRRGSSAAAASQTAAGPASISLKTAFTFWLE